MFEISSGRSEESVYDEVAEIEKPTTISNATLPYLEQLHKLLIDPPYVNIWKMIYFLCNEKLLLYILMLQKTPVKTTTGILDCPVGITRLNVAKLFMKLLATENVKIYETLVKLGTFQTLLVNTNYKNRKVNF